MPRLMSVALTERAVVERRKTVTRRLGWWADKNHRRLLLPGQELWLCRQAMGRKPGEPVERLALVHVTDISRQQLRIANTADEAAREGFPERTWPEFVEFFCDRMHCTPETVVTRIEWRYIDGEVTG